MSFIKLKMLISFFLLSCISYTTSTKPNIFTILSSTTLERTVEHFLTYELESYDEKSIKNILLQRVNETELDGSTDELKCSKLELRDTYISFGNISAMLTNLAYVDFFQLAASSVEIIMKVQDDSVQRNVQINSTIKTEKMTFVGDVNLLGSKYKFTINLTEPTFHLNKNISETSLSTTTIQSETFIFELMTTNLQPKDYNSFLIEKSGLTANILQRMADSWLPPIVELLKKNSNFDKTRDYEKKILRNDGKNLFSYRICHWVKQQSQLSVYGVRITDSYGNMVITDISMNDIGSYESCNGDFFIDEETNDNMISLVLKYVSGTNVLLNQTQYVYKSTPTEELTTEEYAPVEQQEPPIIRACSPIEIFTVEAKIEFNTKKGTNKISGIRDTSVRVALFRDSLINNECPGLYRLEKPILDFLQMKIVKYLTALLFE